MLYYFRTMGACIGEATGTGFPWTIAYHGISVGNNRLPACPRQANFDPGRQLFGLACPAGQVTFCQKILTLSPSKIDSGKFRSRQRRSQTFGDVFIEFKNWKHSARFYQPSRAGKFGPGQVTFYTCLPAGRHCFALCFHRCMAYVYLSFIPFMRLVNLSL